jgi:hypothetical protein
MVMEQANNSRKVADLTVDELVQIIEAVVTRVIKQERLAESGDKREDKRTLEEVLESIERNRFTPPPGSKSASQMVIDERRRREEY